MAMAIAVPTPIVVLTQGAAVSIKNSRIVHIPYAIFRHAILSRGGVHLGRGNAVRIHRILDALSIAVAQLTRSGASE